MIGIKSSWKDLADRQKWAARGASFMTKVQATKAVWFPPDPAESGKRAGTRATRATKRTTTKTTGAAKKTAGRTRKTTKAPASKKS